MGVRLGVLGVVLLAATILTVALVSAIQTRTQGILITTVGIGCFVIAMLLMPRLRGLPGTQFKSPESFGGSPVGILVYVDDVDACAARAVAARAKQIKPVENQFYGDRSGTFADPFGHIWTISTHVEDVMPEEMRRRMSQMKSSV